VLDRGAQLASCPAHHATEGPPERCKSIQVDALLTALLGVRQKQLSWQPSSEGAGVGLGRHAADAGNATSLARTVSFELGAAMCLVAALAPSKAGRESLGPLHPRLRGRRFCSSRFHGVSSR
jgi:hypothetical protein